MMCWWFLFLEDFSGGEGGEIHFILYSCSFLFGSIRIPMLKIKIRSFLPAVGRGGNPHGPNCSSPTDVKSKIAQVRQTSVKDSSSPTDVGQRQLKSDRRRSKIAQVRQTSVKDSSSPTDVGQRELKSDRRRSKIAQVRQTSVKDSSSPTDVGQR